MKNRVITIGTFDGVHLGHQRVVQTTQKIAEALKLEPMVIMLSYAPKFNGSVENRYLITTREERMFLIKEIFSGIIESIDTTTGDIYDFTAYEFIQYLKQKYYLAHMVVGFNHSFGKDRSGNAVFLAENANNFEIGFTVVPPVKIEDKVISSSLIRNLLKEGDVRKANRCLGRFYSLQGIVQKGAGIASTLGFRTINLDIPEKKIIPKNGVYAVITEVSGRIFPGACYIGSSPTLGLDRFAVEVHIIGYNEELYGQKVNISFVDFLREDKKFDNVESLKSQIVQDISQAKALISNLF
ncbi:MAG: bifunctional riboflavin kinase/FAD synthetase [candidate division WOR-3 bacterium]